jgi:GNAT superfamily N-acetyltransferase
MRIRPATREDLPAMIALGAKMHAESAYAGFDFDTSKLVDLGLHYIANPDTCFAVVCEDDHGHLLGMHAGYVSEYYFGRDLIASDLLLFVDPGKRGSLAAAKLVRAFEEWAFAKGAQEVCPGSSTMVAPERTAKLYERLGYTVVGNLFKKGR